MASWHEFFGAQATVFAALTGLIFVSLSVNLQRILSSKGLPGRAGEAIILLLQPVFIGLAGLAGTPSAAVFGVELLVIGAAVTAALGAIIGASWPVVSQLPAATRFVRVGLAALSTLPMIAAGALLLGGNAAGLSVMAAATAASLAAGMTDAWVLLVEILR